MAAEKLLRLQSSDGELFEVTEEVAFQSVTIQDVVKGKSDPYPLQVSSKTLAKVIEFCKYHVKTSKDKPPISQDEIKAWEAEFVKVDFETLHEIILAAKYLHIQSLTDLCCLEVANMMKGKTVEEIRIMFNITNDFTPEEEAENRRENAWAFENNDMILNP